MAQEDDWEQPVTAAEKRHIAGFLTNDVAALDAMFSDDFIVNSPKSTIIQKLNFQHPVDAIL